MKTDAQLHRDVLDELRWQPAIANAEIGVAVKDGVVTLTGKVASYAQKRTAEHAAERVSGVRAIVDDLEVRLPGELHRSDTEIAHAALDALKWDVEVPDDRFTIKVDAGFVTLQGKTDWYYQKAAAERAVRNLTGVRGVVNRIVVAPSVSTVDVKETIEQALKRSAELDAKRIVVEAIDGKVTLKGSVRSWAERLDAERAAWAAPGVRAVQDDLVLSI